MTSAPVSVAIANCGFDWDLGDPDALLARYHALVGWARALAGAGARAVTVVQRFRRDAVVHREGVEYRFIADRAGPASMWFKGARLARTVGTLRPDVVHVNGCVFPRFVRNLRRKLSPAAVIAVQDHGGSGIQDQSPGLRSLPWRRFHRFGLGAADCFLFTANEMAAPWSRAGIIDSGQGVFEIPEASTDLGRLPSPSPYPSDQGPRLPGTPALLWVGRLDPNKDPLTILAGFERAAATLPEAALTLAFGDDKLLPEVRSRVASSPVLGPRVHLRGRVDRADLPALYRGADLFLLGSHREVASFALIEALSFGVIPVVTEIPAFRVLTDAGRLGALFPPGDVDALARAIGRLARADMFALRALVRAHFTRELSWSALGTKALGIYRAAVARRRDRRN